MAPDSWLIKVKTAISSSLDYVRSTMALVANNPRTAVNCQKTKVGILAFEIASLMSKLTHLWRSLSQAHVARLRHEFIALPGARRIVSDDDAYFLRLASAELTESLRLVAESVSAMGRRCADPGLHHFDRSFKEFAELGRDSHRCTMSWKRMESEAKKMDRYVAATATLYKEMGELSEAEHGLRKVLLHHAASASTKITSVYDVKQKVLWKKQKVKYLKETSLWGRSFDMVTSLLARSTFTVMARIKHVFRLDPDSSFWPSPFLPRSLSVSAAVYPSTDSPNSYFPFTSGPLMPPSKKRLGFFEENSTMLSPPSSTLGAASLALHYANLILVLEKMIRSPRSIGADARNELYAMLPASIRAALRSRLKAVGCNYTACDEGLAGEWRVAMERIMEWLLPMAYNTIRWQGERSFERRSATSPRETVLLLQTLYFASREKAEAAIAELLVGLNYVWRFEIETCAKAAASLNCSSH